MLIIVANRQDQTAIWLARRWQSHNAVVLTAADLSVRGWRHYFPPASESRAVVGQEVDPGKIKGVLTRMGGVYEQELPHITPADRSYAASEMNAFLLAWLSSLTCPVLNRPVPNCLAGSDWRPEQWVRLAAQLGIPVRPVRRRAPLTSPDSEPPLGCEVIIVGDRCFGKASPLLQAQARLLAKTAGVGLLVVYFTDPEPPSQFVSSSVWPNLMSPDVADAVLHYLLVRSAC